MKFRVTDLMIDVAAGRKGAGKGKPKRCLLKASFEEHQCGKCTCTRCTCTCSHTAMSTCSADSNGLCDNFQCASGFDRNLMELKEQLRARLFARTN